MKTQIILTPSGPNTWAVQYVEPAPRPRPVASAKKPRPPRRRFVVEDEQYGFRASAKNYRSERAAIQAARCFNRGELRLPGSLQFRCLER